MSVSKGIFASNDKILFFFVEDQDIIVLQTQVGVSYRNKLFSGFEGIKESFEEFMDLLTNDTTFEDAVKFFTPTIGQTFINKN